MAEIRRAGGVSSDEITLDEGIADGAGETKVDPLGAAAIKHQTTDRAVVGVDEQPAKGIAPADFDQQHCIVADGPGYWRTRPAANSRQS
ncbi:MAG: hypothetical protein ABIU29_00850 [Chthoniobacterales bacterium]